MRPAAHLVFVGALRHLRLYRDPARSKRSGPDWSDRAGGLAAGTGKECADALELRLVNLSVRIGLTELGEELVIRGGFFVLVNLSPETSGDHDADEDRARQQAERQVPQQR